MSTEEVYQEFVSPNAQYRGKPFWAWNGVLDGEELRRQIRVMDEMGLGGFFMHSRVGLGTAYLSDEWFDMIKACVDEARKRDMEAWMYDEDRWPSGAAGGFVTKDERYRRRSLVVVPEHPDNVELGITPLTRFVARIEDGSLIEYQKYEKTEDLPADLEQSESYLSFYVKLDDPSSWYNNGTYLDTMNHEAVQRFIEVTHERYREEVGDEFGNHIPGIFTDEPNYGNVVQPFAIEGTKSWKTAWTGSLPETFSKRYGYEIMDVLPEIFFTPEGEEISTTRWDYIDCITFLFSDAFARQIGEWCEENNVMHTGHVLAEGTLRSQSSVVGSAMRFYEHMQAQGIDILTEHNYEYGTAKQCSSVQHQMGRRWVLSETYGCTGWDFSFEGHKAVGDWQAALGINLRCQHLSWYTMAGQAKRDYPASIHYQSPWWRYYSTVEDYFARLAVLTSRGQAVRPLLVVHPVESVWALAGAEWQDDERIKILDQQHDQLRQWLLEEHLDFDYGDEDMIARLGKVDAEEQSLCIGEANYQTVLVPPMLTIRSSTAEILSEFAEKGGKVVFCGEIPEYVDAAKPEGGELDFAGNCAQASFSRDPVVDSVAETRVVSITDENGKQCRDVLYLLHRDGSDYYLFICNTNREEGTGVLKIKIEAEGQVQAWNAETGERSDAGAEITEDGMEFSRALAPTGSAVFVITPDEEDLSEEKRASEVKSVPLPEDGWDMRMNEPNVYVLDRVWYRIEEGDWQGPAEVLKVDNAIRDAIGLGSRGGKMVQPWAREETAEGPKGEVQLRAEFEVDEIPKGPIQVALEDPQRFSITLNGQSVSTEAECGWWVDRSIRVIPLDVAEVKEGTNTIELSGTYDDDAGLETMFLLGYFGVSLNGNEAVIKGLSHLDFGDWTQQDLPFYSGAIAYERTVPVQADSRKVFVKVPDFSGACARVLVDGEEAGVIGWQPAEVEITEYVQDTREIGLTIEVVSHRRNAFGPLHNVETWPRWTGPSQFITSGDQWSEDYNLVPCGCFSIPQISYRTVD
ncbi:MAG: hypothetical protein KGZ25_01830 [Planctomycetes bacterium]|nr:hypothetical protein [Planctomycetota bacterium]